MDISSVESKFDKETDSEFTKKGRYSGELTELISIQINYIY